MTTLSSNVCFDFLSSDHNQVGSPSVHVQRLTNGLEFAFVYPGSRPVLLDSVRLFGTAGSDRDSSGAVGTPDLTIEEVSTSGSVPFLLARNESSLDFLLLAGQIVKGGKQNRGINLDILVAAGATTQIPVTCVEQGRWNGGPRSRFQHGGIEPLSVRTMKMRDAQACRRSDREVVANQHAVWDEIVCMEHAVGARSASHDLLETISHARAQRAEGVPADIAMSGTESGASGRDPFSELRSIDEALRALEQELHLITDALTRGPVDGSEAIGRDREALLRRYGRCERDAARLRTRRTSILRDGSGAPGVVSGEAITSANQAARNACGMLVFMRGEFIAGDIFADPNWFEHVYPDLRDSALLSWDVVRRTKAGNTRCRGSSTDGEARSIVRDAIAADWNECPAVGHGTSLLLQHPELDGAMIAGRDRTPLHMLLGTRSVPRVFAGSRAARRRDLRNFPLE